MEVSPLLADMKARHAVGLFCKVLVRMAYADSVSIDSTGVAPLELPAAVGAVRDSLAAAAREANFDGDAARRMLQWEGDLLDGTEAWVDAKLTLVHSKDGAPDPLAFEPRALENYLRSQDGDAAHFKMTDFHVAPGGFSKQTILVGLTGNHTLPAQIVIRRDHPAKIMPTTVCSEFPLIEKLFNAGMKVPRPLLLEPTGEVLGTPFMAVERIVGKVEGTHLTPPCNSGLARQLAHELGQLHSLGTEAFEDLAASKIPEDPLSLGAEIASLRQEWRDSSRSPSFTIECVFDWLELRRSRIKPGRALLHGDIGFHNLLIHEGKVTGLLDWELARIGHPAEDLGYCRSTVQRMIPWHEFVETYRRAGGPAIDPLTLDFYTLLVLVRFVIYEIRGRGLFEHCKTDDYGMAYIGAHELPALVQRLSTMFREIFVRHS
jgi:aminoglycoside phosphotransferase (APT) family kinase protein